MLMIGPPGSGKALLVRMLCGAQTLSADSLEVEDTGQVDKHA